MSYEFRDKPIHRQWRARQAEGLGQADELGRLDVGRRPQVGTSQHVGRRAIGQPTAVGHDPNPAQGGGAGWRVRGGG